METNEDLEREEQFRVRLARLSITAEEYMVSIIGATNALRAEYYDNLHPSFDDEDKLRMQHCLQSLVETRIKLKEKRNGR